VAGYRSVLAPSTFVYHSGQGSSIDAGILGKGRTTVPENEAILDLRYPRFRSDVKEFYASPTIPDLRRRGTLGIVRGAAQRLGYQVQVGSLPLRFAEDVGPTVLVDPDAQVPVMSFHYKGFSLDTDLDGRPLRQQLEELFGVGPRKVTLTERNSATLSLVEGIGDVDDQWHGYPTRV
jgi:hypothetical protein